MSNLNSPMFSTLQPNGIEKKKKLGSSAGHRRMELFPCSPSKNEEKFARSSHLSIQCHQCALNERILPSLSSPHRGTCLLETRSVITGSNVRLGISVVGGDEKREREKPSSQKKPERTWLVLSLLYHCRSPPSTQKSTLSPFYLASSTAKSKDGIPGHKDTPRKARYLLVMHNSKMLLGHLPGSSQNLLFLCQW